MKMEQVYQILNTVTSEVLGESVIVQEDLSNVVDVGQAFASLRDGLDNYVRVLNDHIGRMVFVDRIYRGRAPSLVMDGWEYGSIMEKVRAELPDAEENESWNLTDRASYDPNVFYKPKVAVKFYDQRVTFDVPMSFTSKQVMSAFSNPTQLNSFFSMIRTAIENTITIKMDALIMRTITTGIAEVLYDQYSGSGYNAGSGVRAINLLYLYNNGGGGNSLTKAAALYDAGFLRFASRMIKLTASRMGTISTLFNVGGTEKFTPTDRLHAVFLEDFRSSAEVYLYDGAGQFKDEFLRLPNADSVPYWQGSGTDFSFGATSKIYVDTPSSHTVQLDGILGVMFDRDAMGVSNLDRRVTTQYNAKAEFWNEFHKYDAGHFLDLDENIVVFFIQ